VKLLLDTHVFIWWFNEPEKLSKKVLAACEDNKNELILSVASIWEMQISIKKGHTRKKKKELTDLKNNTIFNTNKLQTKRTKR
jgi:PIN domain nuclease of toxin-antitoxin system